MRYVFSVEERDRVRDHVLEMASADPRVIVAAVVGSLARGAGDRWSDLDLTFGVMDAVPVDEVLGDWTRELAHRFDAVHLFDLPSQRTIYRVFLLRDCLQVDLSFTPASEFRARGPRFRLLFGSAVETAHVPQPPSAQGFDELPAEVLDPFSDALVRSVGREDLLRALHGAVGGLLRESTEVRDVAVKVEAQLRQLATTSS